MKTTLPLAIAAIASISAAGAASSATAKNTSTYQTHPIVLEKELLITDLAVVDSPLATYPGPFSFGHLIEQLAPQDKLSEFTRGWLASWTADQEVNDQVVSARPGFREKVIDPWMAKDGFANFDDWQVDLANAPFRLLAIVNRIDSGPFVRFGRREVSFGSGSNAIPAYYGSGGSLANTGEARLVFAATDADGEPLEGGFTVIFEYRLPIPPPRQADSVAPLEVRRRLPAGFGAFEGDLPGLTEAERTLPSRLQAARYAADWHALGAYATFDDEYLCALASLTSSITDRSGGRLPQLAQIRTNEGALGAVQEAREYAFVRGKFQMRPVAATPALAFNTDDIRYGRALSRYIDRNQRAILNNSHTVPLSVPDPTSSGDQLPFLAGSALMPKTGDRPADSFRWDAVRVRYSEALRTFSMNTCSGCHCGETNTAFYHIEPRRAGEQSELSKFLRPDSELTVDSLGARAKKIELNEMRQREVIFEAILNPHFDKDKVYSMLRNRVRRAH